MFSFFVYRFFRYVKVWKFLIESVPCCVGGLDGSWEIFFKSKIVVHVWWYHKDWNILYALYEIFLKLYALKIKKRWFFGILFGIIYELVLCLSTFFRIIHSINTPSKHSKHHFHQNPYNVLFSCKLMCVQINYYYYLRITMQWWFAIRRHSFIFITLY